MIRTCPRCLESKLYLRSSRGEERKYRLTTICTECRSKYNRERRKANPEHLYNIERKSKFKRQYGITPEKYDAMLLEQGNGCAICSATEPGGRTRCFPVDHCHSTGTIRGLLCTKCNRGLGLFNDDANYMERAAKYLRGDHPWR